jgi:hypothetical protein
MWCCEESIGRRERRENSDDPYLEEGEYEWLVCHELRLPSAPCR